MYTLYIFLVYNSIALHFPIWLKNKQLQKSLNFLKDSIINKIKEIFFKND
jgi:hypothetical protein